MRQKKFLLDDHQFIVKVESLSNKAPLLSSILDVLEKSLEFMLDNLRLYYKPEDKNLVYLTLHQSEMDSAMNSGAFEISTTSNAVILSHVLGMFNRFIRSNASLRLEKDFSVYFRVLSAAHVNDASNRRGAIIREKFNKKQNYKFGCSEESSVIKRKGCLEVPIGYSQNPRAFKDECLLTHIVLGYYCFAEKFKIVTENNITFKQLTKINSKNKNVQNKAGNLLQSLILQIKTKFNLSLHGPYTFNDLAPILSKHYNCQIHLINGIEQTQVGLLSEPETFDDSKHQIYLLSTLSNHVILISNLKTFFSHNRKVCLECKKSFSKNHFHVCKARTMCHNCKSFYASLSTIDITSIRYCDSEIEVPLDNPIICVKCEMKFLTQKCYNLHKAVCYSRWHCQICSRTFNVSPKSAQQIKQEHVCYLASKCQNCRVSYASDEYHLCAIPKTKGDKYWPNLVFFQFAVQNLNSENCLPCFELQNQYCKDNNLEYCKFKKEKVFGKILCPIHSVKTISNNKPNACVIFREISRGEFKEYILCDDSLMSDVSDQPKCDFKYLYCDSSVELPHQNVNIGGRKRVRTNDFTCKLAMLSNKSQKTMLDKFLLLVSQRDWENSVYISHQAQQVNLPSILEAFLSLGVTPNIIQKNLSLHSLEIDFLKSRFLNGSSFLSGTVEEICLQFNVAFEPSYFPENFNCQENYNYSGTYPDVQQYFLFTDSKLEREKKIAFYEKNQLHLNYFDFKNSLLKHLKNQCQAFTISCLKFLKKSIDFQVQLQIHLNISIKTIIHPFGPKCSSISSLSFNQFALYYLQDVDLFATKFDYTGGCTRVSSVEYEFACYFDFLNPELKYEHAFNCANGQRTFGHLKADLYSPVTKTVYNFHGCAYHFCDSCDAISKAKKNDNGEPMNYLKIPYSTLKIRDDKAKEMLLGKFGNDVKTVKIMKECQWKKIKKDDFWELFLVQNDDFVKKRPKSRLIPRICIRSGFLETYILRWQQKDFPNETFYHSDCNGMYAYISLSNEFPVGPYDVLLKKNLEGNIKFDPQLKAHFYKGQPMSGSAAHVRILAPCDLKKPFLSFRSSKEHTFMGLCRSCIENNDENSKTKCSHVSPNSRYFESCWMVTELDKAVSLGYIILEWFEVHFFSKRLPLLSSYVSILSALKLQNTGCDLNFTLEQKQQYCDDINAKLKVPSQFQLTPLNISENSGQKQFYKSMLNNYLGKFIQNTQHSTFRFVQSQTELEKYCFNPDNEVIGIYPYTEDLCQVEYKPILKNVKPSKKANLYIGAEIIAKARVYIYNCIETLEKASARIFFVDTDGIGYSLDKSINNPLQFSNCTGDFKAVQSNIVSFHALGNRNYTIGYIDSSDVLKYDYKVKGLSLTSEHVRNIMSPNLYENFLDKHFKEEFDQIYLPQVKNKVDMASKQSKATMHTVKFTNNLFVKRYINSNVAQQTYETFPYGFKE